MSLNILAEKIHAPLIAALGDSSPVCLFLSASDMKSRAITRHACAASAEEAWQIALKSLKEALAHSKTKPTILRADWVTDRQEMTWEEARRRIAGIRRNYFRQGIAFDTEWKCVFTEQELNANAMLNTGGDRTVGEFNAKNSTVYCRQRFGCDLPEPEKLQNVILFETRGMFCETEGTVHQISGKGPEAGRRDIASMDAETVRSTVAAGAHWLARQCGADGRFNYGFFPCFDRAIPTYNTLRHISSTWALLDVYKLTGNKTLRAAAERAIGYLMKNFARRLALPDGTEALFFEDKESNEIKLGSSGVALLLFSTYTELIHPKRYIPLMNAIARGIMYLQNAEGGFTHVLNSSDFSVKQAFRIVYYDGEAVFGLLRLYAITKSQPLLEAVEKAFDCFIRKNHWKHHDHWLSYSVNELTRWKTEARYFEFGINNFLDYISFVRRRETAFPTLLELMMAADAMLRRMENMPEMQAQLARVNKDRFYDALRYRAGYLLNSFFWPETAMFFKNPQRICGSFYIRHHAFRTRIDDVEHYLSGLTGYVKAMDSLPCLPDSTTEQLPAAPVQSHTPSAPARDTLRIGLIRENKTGFWHPQNTTYAMLYTAKHFNIEMCLFSLDDIDFDDWTVDAIILEENTKTVRTIPIPEIIDNPILGGRKGMLLKKLDERCTLIRHSLNTTKKKTHDILLNDGRFKDFLIQTTVVGSYDIFLEKFHEYNNDVIIKPSSGCRGSGIQRITQKDDVISVLVDKKVQEVPDFEAYFQKNFSDTVYIIQPFIQSRTLQGNPFDIRIHCRRGKDGVFKVTPFPRIGNASGVVSNISTGGYSMNLDVFLKQEFGSQWRKVLNDLTAFGKKFPDYYQSLFPVSIFDIGVDMGIHRAQDKIEYKIFEVNTYIDGPFFEIEDAITHFEYYRYLAEQKRRGGL